jgi:hypothetical protein
MWYISYPKKGRPFPPKYPIAIPEPGNIVMNPYMAKWVARPAHCSALDPGRWAFYICGGESGRWGSQTYHHGTIETNAVSWYQLLTSVQHTHWCVLEKTKHHSTRKKRSNDKCNALMQVHPFHFWLAQSCLFWFGVLSSWGNKDQSLYNDAQVTQQYCISPWTVAMQPNIPHLSHEISIHLWKVVVMTKQYEINYLPHCPMHNLNRSRISGHDFQDEA